MEYINLKNPKSVDTKDVKNKIESLIKQGTKTKINNSFTIKQHSQNENIKTITKIRNGRNL